MADRSFCYLTTTGRRTGRPHTIEIWFGMLDGGLYVLAGGRGDWLRNLEANPAVTVRIGSRDAPEVAAQARMVTDPAEHEEVRRVMDGKYPGYPNWIRDATPVAVEHSSEEA